VTRPLAPVLLVAALACTRPAAPAAPDAAGATPPEAAAAAAEPSPPDAATPDAATPDAATPDAATPDAADGGSVRAHGAAPAEPSGGAASGAPATGDAGVPSPLALDAGSATATHPPPPLTAAVAIVAGQEVALAREGVSPVDPAASFRVEVAVHLSDGRLSLHDEADAMVASTGTTELGASRSRYVLTPEEPLRPGTGYTLHLDGAVTREPHDAGGQPYAPLVLKVRTTGERPPATPAKKAQRRRRE
jgi:hypothetical protein